MIILQGKMFSEANEFPVEECVYTFHHSLSNEQISSRTMVPKIGYALQYHACMYVCMFGCGQTCERFLLSRQLDIENKEVSC